MSLATVLLVASTALSAVGSLAKASAEASAARMSADIARQQAAALRQAGAEEARRRRQAGERLLGTQLARFAKSGVVTDEGTPLLVMMETAREIERDALLSQLGFETEARTKDIEAQLFRRQARAARVGGAVGAGQSLLSGAFGLTQLR